MAKTGLVIASGLAKAVDSFFKARKLRDLNAQAQSMEQIKYLKGLEDLNNARAQGGILTQKKQQSSALFPSELAYSQARQSFQESKSRTQRMDEDRINKLAEFAKTGTLTDAGSTPWDKALAFASIYDRPLGSEEATIMPGSPQRFGEEASTQQAKDRSQLILQQVAASKASEGLINQRMTDAQYKNIALTKSAEPLGDPVFDQYFAPATALIADKPEQIAVYKNSIRESLSDGQINTAQAMFRTATKGSMSATGRDKMQRMEIAVESTSRIKDELDEYYRLGGSTGLFDAMKQTLSEGAASQAFEKIAAQQIPALQRVTLSIKDEFFKFRQAVSGAAFSEQETKDYYSLWPQAELAQSVNEGRINSMLERDSLKVAYQYMSAAGVPDIETVEKLIGQIYRYDVSQVPRVPLTPEQVKEMQQGWDNPIGPAKAAEEQDATSRITRGK